MDNSDSDNDKGIIPEEEDNGVGKRCKKKYGSRSIVCWRKGNEESFL